MQKNQHGIERVASPADLQGSGRTNGLGPEDPSNAPTADQGHGAAGSQSAALDGEPKKKRGGGGYKQRPGTVQRGMKVRLYPRSSSNAAMQEWGRQTRTFDRWSKLDRELSNRFLCLQQAVYSGANDMPHLRVDAEAVEKLPGITFRRRLFPHTRWLSWRQVLAEVAHDNYRIACEKYEAEYPGCLANPPSPPDPMPALLARIEKDAALGRASDRETIARLLMESLDRNTRKAAETALRQKFAAIPDFAPMIATPKDARAFVKQLRQMAKEVVKKVKEDAPRQPPRQPDLDLLLARNLTQADGTFTEPCLFMWEPDAQKVMAVLKHAPHMRWTAELPSHACQKVIKEQCKALGEVSKGKGFPKFKRATPDGESVYFANTQLIWDIENARVKFPAKVGWVDFEGGRAARRLRLMAEQTIVPKEGDEVLRRTGDDKFLGARLWRRGKQWWLSPQFEVAAKPAPQFTGRHVAVKIGGGTLATVYDGVTFKEFKAAADPRHRHGDLLRRARSRSIDAMAARKRKTTLRAAGRRKAKGLPALPRPARLPRSREFLATNAAISITEASDANRRGDSQHKLSRRIVRMGDSLTLDSLDIAGMMAKEQDAGKRREQMRRRRKTRDGEAGPDEIVHKAPPKVLRKALRRASPARFVGFLDYKAEEAGRPVNKLHELDPRVIKCGAKIKSGKRAGETCGHLNYVMKDGRPLHQCSGCGALMRRNINAAENVYDSGQLTRQSGLEAAE